MPSDLIKKIEKIDYFDYGVSHNPIKVFNNQSCGENRYEPAIARE